MGSTRFPKEAPHAPDFSAVIDIEYEVLPSVIYYETAADDL